MRSLIAIEIPMDSAKAFILTADEAVQERVRVTVDAFLSLGVKLQEILPEDIDPFEMEEMKQLQRSLASLI